MKTQIRLPKLAKLIVASLALTLGCSVLSAQLPAPSTERMPYPSPIPGGEVDPDLK